MSFIGNIFIFLADTIVKTWALVLLFSWQTGAFAAEPAFISDKLEVNLRTGKGLDFKILKRLEGGTPVTVLQRDPKSGYSKIKLEEGLQGWILDRYLSDQPGTRQRLAEAIDKLQRLETENLQLREQLTRLTDQQSQTESAKTVQDTQTARLQAELRRIRKSAAHALEIEAERNQLRERVVSLERELQKVKLEKQALENESAQSWFAIGAGVLLAGILVGLILPRLGWRKRRNWNTF